MVPCVEMFTTAGDTCLIIGDSDGTGVSPIALGTEVGSAASAGSAALVRNAAAARGAIANRTLRKKGARDIGRIRSIVSQTLILMCRGLSDRKGPLFFTSTSSPACAVGRAGWRGP